MVDFRFNDSAYLGQSPNRTTHERLAYLGSLEADTGVCVQCDDEAFLGLAPGRTTFSRAAYIGLFEPVAVVPPATIVVRPPEAWSSHDVWLPYSITPNAVPETDDEDEDDDDEAILAILLYSMSGD